jgi:hypothetical protein
MSFRSIIGSFQILRRRAREVGNPGLAVWADAGERAAVDVQSTVRDGAHRAETEAREIEREMRDILADGKVSRTEVRTLKRLEVRVRGVAEVAHDVGEVVS